ncbi:dethiobiotin synthase [Marinobacter daepoensis]|uniref:ATP-dependent dethiobiotin synthetase BioD n=1 Tax=Marinobacter daepoensis TaxID=262077 RepID=A0ABS3BH31_9GAMM|nr:dethiobiotin synthase [Marinobacter daepoensis]MBN7771158.1 dethiobiotin synthase [Marinobacter daepoensis]MBY6079020.1 dethiobiotin synthase [Marinobacter daepoensis]
MAKRSFFVTGTDTGVGKTIVSAAILEAAKAAGKRTLAMKPVASGCDQTPEGLRNEDALMLQAAMTETLPYETINPIALEPAIAPHVAAQQVGKQVTAQRIVGFCRGMQIRPADLMLIEGAGGWRVPLNDRETYAVVAGELRLPVILVVPLKLGCINHAMLTAEAVRADGLSVAGWVGNRPEEQVMNCEKDTLNYLSTHLNAPCLGVLPWLDGVDHAAKPAVLSRYMNIAPLIEN